MIAGAYASPLDVVVYPDQVQAQAIIDAGESAVQQCMAERGFDYQGGEFPYKFYWEQAATKYTVTDGDQAAEYGFRSALWMNAVNVEPQEVSSSQDRPDGYEGALFGTGAGSDPDQSKSCLGEALDTVIPGWPRVLEIMETADSIVAQAHSAAQETKEVKSGCDAWSACMVKSGYDYPDPWQASEKYTADRPNEEELQAAVASAKCMHSSGLLEAWSRVEALITLEILEDNPGIVDEWLALQNEAFDRLSEREANARS